MKCYGNIHKGRALSSGGEADTPCYMLYGEGERGKKNHQECGRPNEQKRGSMNYSDQRNKMSYKFLKSASP